ncbi:MAG TPA: hypothetical protein VNZ06_07185 [Steroidobacteraceae bacterium]|nr:hypothetical protein [Steroidobacteraceae bacterium]
MEPNTAAQRSPVVTHLAGYSLLASIKPQPVGRETEYGCVDWYTYADTAQSRKDWFDHDSGLAVGDAA